MRRIDELAERIVGPWKLIIWLTAIVLGFLGLVIYGTLQVALFIMGSREGR